MTLGARNAFPSITVALYTCNFLNIEDIGTELAANNAVNNYKNFGTTQALPRCLVLELDVAETPKLIPGDLPGDFSRRQIPHHILRGGRRRNTNASHLPYCFDFFENFQNTPKLTAFDWFQVTLLICCVLFTRIEAISIGTPWEFNARVSNSNGWHHIFKLHTFLSAGSSPQWNIVKVHWRSGYSVWLWIRSCGFESPLVLLIFFAFFVEDLLNNLLYLHDSSFSHLFNNLFNIFHNIFFN